MAPAKYNIYVGAETGLFKGVNTDKKVFNNLNSIQDLTLKKQEITTLCWGDEEESEICIGLKDQVVKIYNTTQECFTETIEVKGGEGGLRGLNKYQGHFLTCVESGLVKLWKEGDEEITIDAGNNVYRMRQSPLKPSFIATGGEENDLKIWDLNRPKEPVFRAKNVAPNFLDLRVPVWVTDMQFIPDSEKIVTCSRHHHVRVYDPSTPRRRPVINIDFEEYPLMTLSLTHRDNQVVVGSSRGRMALMDLRKRALVHVYKGFAGSIRSVLCHPTLPLVASCALDRFLRIHDLYTHQLLVKMYLKSRLNCLLFYMQYYKELSDDSENVKDEKTDTDKMWEQMDVIEEEQPAKRKKQ